jgi:hypothetical protein
MRNILIRLALCAMLFALCFPAAAQQPAKVPRIGYLVAGDAASESTRFEVIRRALRERGYIEGQNIASEYRYAEGKRDRPDGLYVVGGPLMRANEKRIADFALRPGCFRPMSSEKL